MTPWGVTGGSRKFAALALLAALFPTEPASAMSGYELFDRCTAGPDDVCMGYIVGVLDSVQLTGWSRVCLPADATMNEAQAEVSGFLRNNLSRLGEDGPVLVVDAMQLSWPCRE